MAGAGVDVQCDTLHIHACSGHNRVIPLMRWPNIDSTPNKPITLLRNQLLIRYAVTSPVHSVNDTVLRYTVALQVCTQLYANCHWAHGHNILSLYIIAFSVMAGCGILSGFSYF
jgi:hypothetical protein